MDWYYAQDGRHIGPVADAEFTRLVSSGAVTPATLVWHGGMTDWVSYGSLVGVAAARPGPPPAAMSAGEARRFCSSCGNSFAVGDLAFFGDSGVCAACKPAWVQRLRQGMTSTAPMHMRYAGFWIRVAAYLIDTIIVAIGGGIVGGVLGAVIATSGSSDAFNPLVAVVQIIAFVLGVCYYIFFWTRFGATPGKMILKLKVVTPEGELISVGQAVGRYFSLILSAITLCIGFMMAGWDDEKRALHDRIAGTRVIHTE